jgi:hypothetical protein
VETFAMTMSDMPGFADDGETRLDWPKLLSPTMAVTPKMIRTDTHFPQRLPK